MWFKGGTCSIPLIFNSCPPLHNMTAPDILSVHMYFCSSNYKCLLRWNISSVCLLQLTRSHLILYLILCISLGTLHNIYPFNFSDRVSYHWTFKIVVQLATLDQLICSDGGPTFRGDIICFCLENGIKHELSVPYNLRSNGLAELEVKKIKSILIKCLGERKDIQRAWYEWRNAPGAQLRRSQNMLLPQPVKAFEPLNLKEAALLKDKCELWRFQAPTCLVVCILGLCLCAITSVWKFLPHIRVVYVTLSLIRLIVWWGIVSWHFSVRDFVWIGSTRHHFCFMQIPQGQESCQVARLRNGWGYQDLGSNPWTKGMSWLWSLLFPLWLPVLGCSRWELHFWGVLFLR